MDKGSEKPYWAGVSPVYGKPSIFLVFPVFTYMCVFAIFVSLWLICLEVTAFAIGTSLTANLYLHRRRSTLSAL